MDYKNLGKQLAIDLHNKIAVDEPLNGDDIGDILKSFRETLEELNGEENQRMYEVENTPFEEIKKIVAYLYEDESRHAEEMQREEGHYNGHIFASIEEVDNWINYVETGNHKIL